MNFKSFWSWLLLAVAGVVSFDFIRVPFTNDVAIFMGVANIADRFYPFPQGIDLAWEAKPIGNRLINYAVLKGAGVFAPFQDSASFAMASKFIALIVVIAVSLYVASTIGGRYTGWIVFFSFVTVCNFCVMQAEWWATLFSLLVLALLISKNEYAPYLAGMIFIFIGTIKGITALLFIPILCGVYLLGKIEQEAIARAIQGIVAAGCMLIIAQLTIWPNMIPDLLLAPSITGLGRNQIGDLVLTFIWQGVLSTLYIPLLFVGLVTTSLVIFTGCLKTRARLYAFLIMWLSAAAMVFIHSEYFLYQYMVCALPALVTVFICERCVDAAE